MKKILRNILCSVLALSSSAIIFAGCGKSAGTDTWNIGAIGPTSGENASYGLSVKQGAEIAVNEINEKGGIAGYKISFKFEDDKAQPAEGVTAYSSLKDWGMKISLGCVTSGSCADVAVQAHTDNMFLLTPSSSDNSCIKEDNAFRICFDDPYQGTNLAKYIKNNYDVSENKIGILYNTASDYSKGIYDAFSAEIGVDITTATFNDDKETVFTAQASQLSDCDIVVLPIYYQAAAAYLKAAQSNMNVTYFGGDGLDGIISELGSSYADLAEGINLLTPFNAGSSDETVSNFVNAYKAKYNATPDQFAADGYDAVYTVKAAIEKAIADGSNITPASSISDICNAMKTAMTKITVKGATGEMTWGADGAPVKSANIVTIRDGQYTQEALRG